MVGNDFRSLADTLTSDAVGSSELELQYRTMVDGLVLSEGRRERAKAINTDVVGIGRLFPEVDGFIWYQDIEKVPGFINNTVKTLIETVGVK